MRDDDRDARRYAAGDLPREEAAAFERRLGDDQAARDALCRAVERGGLAPAPDPAYRVGVRRRLRPGLWNWLTRRHTFRGHPVAWLTIGAVAAALLFLALTRPAPVAVEAPVSPPAETAATPTPPAVTADEAAARNDGDPTGHVREDDHRLARDEEHISPLQSPQATKH